jgi:hypothetical protein
MTATQILPFVCLLSAAPALAQTLELGPELMLTGVANGPAEDGSVVIRFVIFDEGDDQLDSLVALDNLRWGLNPVGQPTTQQ